MSPLSSELEYRPLEPKTQVSHAMGSACCVFEGSREKTGQFNALGHVLRDEHLLPKSRSDKGRSSNPHLPDHAHS